MPRRKWHRSSCEPANCGNPAGATGVASGIGFAAAWTFADRGMRVVFFDLSGNALDDAVAEIGERAFAIPTDVADCAAVEALAAKVAKDHGTVSVLMNNAAIGSGGDVLADPSGWDKSCHSRPMTSKTTIGEREKGRAAQKSIRQLSCMLADDPVQETARREPLGRAQE
jgi:NAD(P)-dependent dehydrogenase (short-subunit alcohol dehydrogenase family)